jgi:outer membrane protein OmpA-like peptidoglycan-associated protein
MLSSPVAAQRVGAIEAGAFGRYTIFDPTLPLDQWFGYGGRLGIFALPRIELEGDISQTKTSAKHVSGDFKYIPIHARLIYNQPIGETGALLIGGGYVRNKYQESYKGDEDGAAALLGWRSMVEDWVAVRFDVTADYVESPINKAKDNWNVGIQGGVSFFLFNRKSKPAPQEVAETPPPPPPPPAPPQPADADQDGVQDSADRCPNTPAGESVDSNGCAPSQLDADHDGVSDSADRCPNTPSGESVDSNGCAPSQRDSDNDGATDDKDRCPNTPAGKQVDTNGCPVIFEESKTAVVLQGVNFEFGKATLVPEARDVLDQVAASLIANPDIRVEVAGYTDSRGSKAVNIKLSQARAAAVQSYLVEKGVPASQLEAKGYGPANPVASNATEEGRTQNRRVELHRIN